MKTVSFRDRIKNAWSIFKDGRDDYPKDDDYYRGYSYSSRPDRIRLRGGNDKSIISAIYTRIAIDISSIDLRHVRLDHNDKYKAPIDSELNQRLSVDANKDQSARAFMQDVVMSLFDEGVVAIVPVDISTNPRIGGKSDILSWRTGKITEWRPDTVRVKLYNDRTGNHEEVVVHKSMVAIVENPLYSVMNEPNSMLQRLIRKLGVLDAIDEQSSSGKLDLIIQLPYVIKNDARKAQAEKRRKDIEDQLYGSKYGIAYTDGTEKITQLNRPAENNIMAQITYLTGMVMSQLGLTEGIFDGTADEAAMLNYHNRTTEPVLSAIVDEMKIKFLSKTARSQKQSIMFFRNPFKLVPVSELANIGDKFTRNEILSSNEMRSIIGYQPSEDPRADELRNKNINASNDQLPAEVKDDEERENQNE